MQLFEKMRKKGVYIFGAGNRGKIVFDILKERDIFVTAFIDNNPKMQGKSFCGEKCISIDGYISEGGEENTIIVSPINNEDILLQLQALNIKNVYSFEDIEKANFFSPIIKEKNDYRFVHPFNHYESPYPDLREIHEKEGVIFNENREVLDVDFGIDKQIELAKKMSEIEPIVWTKEESFQYRYYYENDMFGKGSADALYYMMRILKPKRIIEVGSGFSTAVMLDTKNAFFNSNLKISCIEPYAERLKSLLRNEDDVDIYETYLQEIPLDFFSQLGENDILFIDSSHVSKIDSDVNYYLFEIFPRLAKGVYIHIHDVRYPFVYPKEWIYQGRAYNEMYLLRAFLMNNDNYSIYFFGDMLAKKCPNEFNNNFLGSGSLWLKKGK